MRSAVVQLIADGEVVCSSTALDWLHGLADDAIPTSTSYGDALHVAD